MRTRTRALLPLAGALVLAYAVAGRSTTVFAQQHVHPRLFALAAGSFPDGSRITRSNVETNSRLVADEATHFGIPPAIIGRISGYYMVAEEANDSAASTAYTSYLVSIFGSPRQAQAAFNYRWELWYTANFYTAPAAPTVKLGSKGAVALFHTLDPRLSPTTELFFRRGCILVEVVQGTDQPSAEETRSLYAIAQALDAVARAHPRGV
jgi:hypothetical protein